MTGSWHLRPEPRAAAPRVDERIRVELPITVSHHGRERKESLADLSHGGAFLRTRKPLPPGTDVMVSLRPPGSLTKLHLQAKVAWVRRSGEDAGMGLEFVLGDARQVARLPQLVERLGHK